MAGITFSGFNNIDFNQVVSAIIAQERQPITRLTNQQTTLNRQHEAFGTLAGKLGALQSAVEAFRDSTAAVPLTAASTDAGVGAVATTGAIEGTYEIVVTSMARRQVTASSTRFESIDALVATGGTLTLTGADGSVATIAVDAMMTVKELVDAINLAKDSPVTASLVQSAPGSYQIVLTGRHSGAQHAFTVGSTLDPGQLSFEALQPGGGLIQTATDAVFTVNGVAIQSPSNTASDVVPGVALTITKSDVTATVSVTKDAEGARAAIDKVTTAYNDLMAFLDEQRTAAVAGNASIARDPLVQQLRASLRSVFLAPHANHGELTRLSEVGLGFDRTGRMVLDEKLFKDAIASRAEDVQALFSGSGDEDGAFDAVRALVEAYTRSGGLVADVRERLTSQMRSLTDRIDMFEQQLERRRLTLQQEFQAADEAISQLNAQMSSLAALGGQYRLF